MIDLNKSITVAEIQTWTICGELIGTATKVLAPTNIWAAVSFDGVFLGIFTSSEKAKLACQDYIDEHGLREADASKE